MSLCKYLQQVLLLGDDELIPQELRQVLCPCGKFNYDLSVMHKPEDILGKYHIGSIAYRHGIWLNPNTKHIKEFLIVDDVDRGDLIKLLKTTKSYIYFSFLRDLLKKNFDIDYVFFADHDDDAIDIVVPFSTSDGSNYWKICSNSMGNIELKNIEYEDFLDVY